MKIIKKKFLKNHTGQTLAVLLVQFAMSAVISHELEGDESVFTKNYLE